MSPARRSPEVTARLRATLVEHAGRLIAREGPSALTMRALATEAGCAVGLPYKVFADRRELVAAIVRAELRTLRVACDELIERAGNATVGANLARLADAVLGSPAVALTQEVLADPELVAAVTTDAHHEGIGPAALPGVISAYLRAEKVAGRVGPDVDDHAFGFLIAGALHNLIVAGEAWPRPNRPDLERILTATAAAIGPQPPEPEAGPMTHQDDPTPYRKDATKATRRRNRLIVVAGILAAAAGLVLHAVGVFPPN